jgi:hypothetical protein
MTIHEFLSWVALGGSIGGVTAVLIKVKLTKDGLLLGDISVRSDSFLCLGVFSLLIGSAAALAFQWILIGINEFRSNTTIEDIVFILATSVVTGFVAREILPIITNQLEAQIRNVGQKVEHVHREVVEKVEHVEQNVRETRMEDYVITRGLASLNPNIPEFEVHKSRNELASYLELHPTARTVAIVLARLYAEAEDSEDSLTQAIAVLGRFLKAKADLHQIDKDYADALYNRAFYYIQRWKKTADVRYKDQAYEDLTKSVEVFPLNKVDAQHDEDFTPLWDEDRFRALGTTDNKKPLSPHRESGTI